MIAEICRVLKPGGTVLIVDIRQYAAALRAGGCTVRRAGSDLGTKVVMVITLGLVRPGNLIARRDAQPANPILIDQHVPSPANPKK